MEWLSTPEALMRNTYPNERRLIELALTLLGTSHLARLERGADRPGTLAGDRHGRGSALGGGAASRWASCRVGPC